MRSIARKQTNNNRHENRSRTNQFRQRNKSSRRQKCGQPIRSRDFNIEGFSLVEIMQARRGGNACNRQNIRLCMRAHYKRDNF